MQDYKANCDFSLSAVDLHQNYPTQTLAHNQSTMAVHNQFLNNWTGQLYSTAHEKGN